jgi:outer membrane lipoprotein-sorting protein
MKRFRLTALAALLLAALMPSLAWAGEAEDVLGKIRDKYEKFEAGLTDMTMTMDITAKTPGQDVMMEQKIYRKGDRTRIESFVKNPETGKPEARTHTILINDGRESWMMSPFAGRRKMPAGPEAPKTDDWWSMITEKARVTGEERVNGREAYVIRIEGEKGGPEARMWVEKKDLTLLKAESAQEGRTANWVFSDFKRAGEWELPYRTEMFADGKLSAVTVVRSVDLNKGLPDDLFDLKRPMPWEEPAPEGK